MSEQGLKDKTVKGVGWSAIDNVAQYAVQFIVSIVLARLLSPDDYGLLGIIAIFTAVCSALIDGGFSSALIRKKNATKEDFNTIFILNLVMSILLYFIIFFCSPIVARFFGREELVLLTRISSIGLILGAFSLVQQTILTKRIDFKTQTKISIVSSIVSGIVGIIMAVLGYGVWALVAQNLMSLALRTVLLWVLNNWMPQFRFSLDSFKELYGFGWKMMVSQLLNTIWGELFQVVVAKYYSPATLGQYTRANHFSQIFSKNFTAVIQRVTYPVLSEMQDDKVRMVGAYRRIIKTTMFITTICMFSLGAISEPLIYCLIGPKWHMAAVFLPLICANGSLYPLHAINLNMLQVQGRSDLFLGLEVFKKILALGPLCVGVFIGIMPMLYVNLVVGFINFFLNSYYSGKFLGYSSWIQLKDILPSYGVATIVAFSVYFLKYLPISYWGVLPLQLIVGFGVLITVCKITHIAEYDETIKLLSPFLMKLKILKNEKQ